jgi:hypothetical protein
VSAERSQRDGAEPSETDRSAVPAPSLTIINKDATPEEIAAITAVIASMGSVAPPPEKPRSLWAARQRRTRAVLRPGPGAWRASGLPR